MGCLDTRRGTQIPGGGSHPHRVIAGASCPGNNRRLGGWLFPDRMEIRAHDLTPGPSIEWRTAMEEYIGLDV
ncbi:MAG: hypothetical protein E5V25_00505 [Mesorhizobium sp.]|nr:hypothetical protein EOA85_14650 [Mesorhizobium sp. M5C.F.Ca.IN.020.29.1.1]RWA95882.1 MAG: hypothetical protein EOQ33_34375 [Mesorhizobium sp.]TGU00607.1 hypothetical protein EN807_12510 [Mesorhizobium sp. M5C.F.Ca.ET.164.01.1.1]RWC24225.1 MAG: hypothetical protein EOS51_04585 [Mesorhizobium sp.]RWD85467.1 MAG: hypothetical protein EOS48_05095 [Mesorhizobium sp.]